MARRDLAALASASEAAPDSHLAYAYKQAQELASRGLLSRSDLASASSFLREWLSVPRLEFQLEKATAESWE